MEIFSRGFFQGSKANNHPTIRLLFESQTERFVIPLFMGQRKLFVALELIFQRVKWIVKEFEDLFAKESLFPRGQLKR